MLCISSSFSVSTRSSGDGSADQDELEAIGEAIEAYEAVRGPNGKVDGARINRNAIPEMKRRQRGETLASGVVRLL
jgi:hypothetical protein